MQRPPSSIEWGGQEVHSIGPSPATHSRVNSLSLSLFSLSFSRRDIEIFKSTFYNNGNTSKNYSKGIKLQEIYVREFSNNSLDVGQCTLARVRLYQSRTRILSVFLYSSFFLRTFARATVMVTLLAAEVGFEESFGTLRVTLARS